MSLVRPASDRALEPAAMALAAARAAQQRWASTPVVQRLAVIRRLRHLIAEHAEALAAAVPLDVPGSLHRTLADTLVAEVLPLAEGCRFLEQNAGALLAPRQLGRRGRPFFLRSVRSSVERVPLGTVLILGPANYPLFLPGAQALQALAAGNAVLWKPAATGANAARLLADLLRDAGLPDGLVTVLDTDIESAHTAIAEGVDKVVLTGHVFTGQAVLRLLAETVTPAVMELSGCDASFVFSGADLDHAARAIAFALRLNGSATCMAPRRLFLVGNDAQRFASTLLDALSAIPPVPLPAPIAAELDAMIRDAERHGARVLLRPSTATHSGAVVIAGATPAMRCMQTDIFAPLLAICEVPDEAAALAAYHACPYALTASIFAPMETATRFARTLRAGTVLINDVIVSTADPRLPFGGRGRSGFGVTRGAEGLLEMTAVRAVVTQHGRSPRPYTPTSAAHAPFFAAYIRAAHSSRWGQRLQALRTLVQAARRLPTSGKAK